MSQLSTRSGVEIDFRRGFELSSIFERGSLEHPGGLHGELCHRDDSGRTQKYSITARAILIQNAKQVVYDLVPTVDFRDTCLNIFKAMLTVLTVRVAKFVSPQRKNEVQQQFEQLLETRQAETRFQMFDRTLDLLGKLKAMREAPDRPEPDIERANLIFNFLTDIRQFAKEFSACREPEKSVDVVIRMERARYEEGLFGQEDGGYTQPFLFKAQRDDVAEKMGDGRGMFLSNGKAVYFDPRSYTTAKEVESSTGIRIEKDGTITVEEEQDRDECEYAIAQEGEARDEREYAIAHQEGEARDEWEYAIAQEGEARDLAEKLYGGEWTNKQVKLFAAALDEMIFIPQQFTRALSECPTKARTDIQDPAAGLMYEYGTRLDTPPRPIPLQNLIDDCGILDAGFARQRVLSALGEDPMFRSFFAGQVASDARLTDGMTPDQIADVVKTFSTISLRY